MLYKNHKDFHYYFNVLKNKLKKIRSDIKNR
jgi:hypothetical protein